MIKNYINLFLIFVLFLIYLKKVIASYPRYHISSNHLFKRENKIHMEQFVCVSDVLVHWHQPDKYEGLCHFGLFQILFYDKRINKSSLDIIKNNTALRWYFVIVVTGWISWSMQRFSKILKIVQDHTISFNTFDL